MCPSLFLVQVPENKMNTEIDSQLQTTYFNKCLLLKINLDQDFWAWTLISRLNR
jgi:hypothetical protein